MTFDKPEHKEIVLDMLNKVSVPGQFVELFYELKKAAVAGEVVSVSITPDADHRPVDLG